LLDTQGNEVAAKIDQHGNKVAIVLAANYTSILGASFNLSRL